MHVARSRMTMSDDDVYDLEDVSVIRESEKAICCKHEVHGEFWVPKSQIAPASEVYSAETSGTLVVKEWIAREKGWLS